MAGKGGLKIVFVGGGSLRILPIVRGLLHRHPAALDGGAIRLVDRVVSRAETVGRLLDRIPERKNATFDISWSSDIERSLDGADVLYVTMAVGRTDLFLKAQKVCMQNGFIASDQISPTGAFLALTAGPTILRFARLMEKSCPTARMLIYANPVAVYSGMVGNHTKVSALGLCGGFANHRYDLTRILTGRDGYSEEYDVDVAGVNHLSFIIRGRHRGRDLYELIAAACRKPFRRIALPRERPAMRTHINYGLIKLREMHRRFGYIIYSTEGDGMAHLFHEEMYERSMAKWAPPSPEAVCDAERSSQRNREKMQQEYESYVGKDLDARFWAKMDREGHRLWGRNTADVTLLALKGLAGLGREKLVGSRPHRGAVDGFPERAVLEFSQFADRDGFHAAPGLFVPPCFHGLIAALSMHQTLLGDAIAAGDPKILADALFAYPIHQNTRASRRMFRRLVRIFGPQIPDVFQKTVDYL